MERIKFNLAIKKRKFLKKTGLIKNKNDSIKSEVPVEDPS